MEIVTFKFLLMSTNKIVRLVKIDFNFSSVCTNKQFTS